MTAVCLTYILTAEEGFRLDQTVACIVGGAAAAAALAGYGVVLLRQKAQKGISRK